MRALEEFAGIVLLLVIAGLAIPFFLILAFIIGIGLFLKWLRNKVGPA